MKAKIILLLAVILAIALNGCVSSQQNLACNALATVPETSIPKCASIEECSKKVAENFNVEGFGESLLDEEVKKWKNSIALNWHYYNKAKNALKEVQAICSSKNQSELPKKMNETAFYLTQSFQAIDSANKSSFAAIALQESRLRNEGIEEIKEERLFDDFTELNEILNQNQNAKSAFLKRHFESLEEFKKLMQETGFRQEFETEISERDLLNEALPEIFKRLRPASIIAVLAEKAASSIAELLNNQEKLQGSIERLKVISAAKTAKAIENFTGLENSTASEFNNLIGRQKNHEKQLEKENNERIERTEKTLKNIREKIETMQASEFIELDEEFLEELMQELGITASIELRKKEFQSLAEFQQNAFKKQWELELKLWKEKRKKQTIGKKTASLKELEKQSLRLEKEIETAWQEMVENTRENCSAKAQILQEKTKELEKIASVSKEELILLENRVQKTINGNGKEQLLECKKMLQAFKDLKEKTTNKAVFEENTERREKECFEFLENNSGNYQSIKERLEVLKGFKEENNGKNLEGCERLKEELIREAKEKTKSLAEKWQELNLKKSTLEAITNSKELEGIEKRVSGLKEYFEGKDWFLKAASLKEELEKSIQELMQEIENKTKETIIEQMEENAIIEVSGNESIEAGRIEKTTIRIILEAKTSISGQAIIKLPFEFENAELKKSTIRAEARQDKNTLEIRLERIEKGTILLDFEATSKPGETEESLKSILATREKAFFEKKIKIKAKEKTIIKKLTVKTIIPESAENTSASSDWKSLETTTSNGIAEITVYNAINNQEINLVFEIKNPITARAELIKETESENKTVQELELSVKNNLESKLENLKIELSLLESAETISAFDELLSEKRIEKSIGKQFLAEEKLLGFQEKKYKIIATFGKTSFEWKEMINSSLQKAEMLKQSQNTEIAEQAAEFEEQLLFWKENFSEKNTEHKKTVLGLAEELKELENSETSAEQEKAGFEQEINEVEEEIRQAKNLLWKNAKAGEKIKEAETRLESAKLAKTSNLKNAMQELQKAKAALKEAISEVEKEITAEKKEKVQNFLKEIEQFEKTGFEASNEKQEILELDKKAGKELSQGNIQEAEKTLREISEKSEKSKNSIWENAKEKIRLFFEGAEKLKSKKQALESLLKKTEKSLNGVSEKDLADIQYLAPINKQGIGKIKLEINGLKIEELEENAEKARRFQDQNKLIEALEIAEKNKKQLAEKTAKIEETTKTLNEALDELQNDAKKEIEKAKGSISEQNNQDKKAALLIEKAENELEKENLLKAIQYANYASALIALKQEFKLPELPLSIIPLIAIAGIAFALKKKKEKEEKNKHERTQRILRKNQQ